MSDHDITYDIIYTDPPWPQKKGNLRKCRPNQGRDLDYKTCDIKTCFALQDQFFKLASERHNVFMWTIDKFLRDAEKEMEDRGYNLHTRLIWDKTNGVAPAYTVRFAHEYLLWFYKPGKMLMPTRIQRGRFTTVMREPATSHSKKPKCAYEMIETMFPHARKIELFARERRSGWESWGDEID